MARDVVENWINQNLDVTGYVATGWSQNALFFASIGRLNLDAYPIARTRVWTEVINPTAAQQAGWRSAAVQVDFDCRTKRYRERSRVVYLLPNQKGPARPALVEAGWRKPAPDTTMATTLQEVCYRAKATIGLYAKPRAPAVRLPPTNPPPAKPLSGLSGPH